MLFLNRVLINLIKENKNSTHPVFIKKKNFRFNQGRSQEFSDEWAQV